LEVVVGGELEKPRMKACFFAEALQDCALQVVVEQASSTASEAFKGPDVSQKKVLERLIEKEFEVEGAGVGEAQNETRQTPFRPADPDPPEVRPVDLALLCREELKAYEGLGNPRPQPADSPSQQSDTSGVSTIPNHLEDASSP
jgi:hypothetical protein